MRWELITGHTRNHVFQGEWDGKTLQDVVLFSPETISLSNTPLSYEFDYLTLENVNDGKIGEYHREILATAPSRARKRIRKNDVLFATVRPFLHGHALVNFVPENVIVSTGFSVMRSNGNIDPSFLYHLLFTIPFEQQIHELIVGSNYPAVNETDMFNIAVELPTLEEQQYIGAVLDGIDDEIGKLEAELEKQKLTRTALLQQLITGKIRI